MRLTHQQIESFVAGWYLALDRHDPVADAFTFLADRGLDMRFPDGTIHDFATFKAWYDRVTHLFFDEIHVVQSVRSEISSDDAVVDVVVGWQASWFEPPAARSKRTSMDATQRWTVRGSTKNRFGLEIASYNATAEPFKYSPGFSRL